MVASHTPPTGHLACDPAMCPDWESSQRPLWPRGLAGQHSVHRATPARTEVFSVSYRYHDMLPLDTLLQLSKIKASPMRPQSMITLNTRNGDSITCNIQSTFRSPQLAITHLSKQVILASWGCLSARPQGHCPFWKSLAVFPHLSPPPCSLYPCR